MASEYFVLIRTRVQLHPRRNQKCSHCLSSEQKERKTAYKSSSHCEKLFLYCFLSGCLVLMGKPAAQCSKSFIKMLCQIFGSLLPSSPTILCPLGRTGPPVRQMSRTSLHGTSLWSHPLYTKLTLMSYFTLGVCIPWLPPALGVITA